MKPNFIYLTFHPTNSASLFGEQFFMHSLLNGKVEIKDTLEGLDGAIVSIRGNDNESYVSELNEALSKLKWVLVIITGNENSTDLYKQIKHPNCRIWIQTPKLEDEADYYLGFGYPTLTKRFVVEHERIYDWCFAGQVNHSKRFACTNVLETMPNGKLMMTDSFNSGVSYPEYIALMCKSKVIPCPGGPATPDTFRVYEALEAGCIPVVDSPEYWMKVFGEIPGFGLNDWEEFPKVCQGIIQDFESIQRDVAMWWRGVRLKILEDLFKQVKEIS